MKKYENNHEKIYNKKYASIYKFAKIMSREMRLNQVF